MAGFLTYATGGIGLLLIGASETLTSSSQTLQLISNQSSLSQTPPNNLQHKSKHTFITSFIIFITSFLFICNSLISLTDALKSHDQTGVVLQLEVISISVIFLLYSVLCLLNNINVVNVNVPDMIMNTLCLFGFVEEFFMFYMQKKDSDGIENRYYDLILVPVFICIVSTLLELGNEKVNSSYEYARTGRGIGLVMQGMWFVQMGVSFYSNGITDGCFVKRKSRGNFTVRCKGHMEFHRARAVATLQFNCHLALVVCFVCGVYGLLSRKYGVSNEVMQYKPLGGEMRQLDLDQSRFTLDSDEEEDAGGKDVVEKRGGGVAEITVNGNGSHY